MFSVAYLKDLGERAISSFAAGVLSVLGGDAVNAWDMDIGLALGFGLGSAVVTVVQGLVVRNIGDAGTATFLRSRRN